jgi:thiol:disulfide interchange protein DsbD
MKRSILKTSFKKPLLQCLALAAISLAAHPYGLAQQSTAPGLQQRLGGLFSNTKEEQLLEPDQAFKLKVTATGPHTLIADLIPASGYYLYRDRIHFAIKNTRGVAIKAVELPAGKVKNDPSFGRMETYEKPVQARITLDRTPSAKTVTLTAGYQGCNEKTGVCYPPIDKEVNLTLP